MSGDTKLKRQGSNTTKKITRPHKEYKDPESVVNDGRLSNDEKQHTLASLEQDARQLVTAAGEGMDGGEGNNLRDVLLAKAKLEHRSSEAAFAQVVERLQAALAPAQGTKFHAIIANAIDAVGDAERAIDEMRQESAATPSGAPRPGSRAELEEELTKEKLDPGA
jgi:hypothetical protein